MGVLHVEKAPLVAKTLSTSFPQIFLKCSSSFPFKAPTPRKACPKSSTSLFLRDLYVAWSVLGRYVQRLNETCYDQLLGHCSCTVACMTWLSGKGIVHVQRILYHWRKVIPQRTNCADFVIRCETLIDYMHAHIEALNGFRQPQPTKQQTNPHESQNLSWWPWSSITVKPQQVAEKAETHTHVDGIVKP